MFLRYEPEFFVNVVSGRDIVSWGAVDRNRPNGQNDELIGFVTARVIMAKNSEVSPYICCPKFLFVSSAWLLKKI